MKKRIIIILICIFFILTCCTAGGDLLDDDSGMYILSSFFPAYAVTNMIAGGIDGVHTACMTQPQQGRLTDYILTDYNFDAIAGSSVFFTLGDESFFQDLVNVAPTTIVALNAEMQLIDGVRVSQSDEIVPNGSFWLSCDNMLIAIGLVRDVLADIDEENSALYENNYLSAAADIEYIAQYMDDALGEFAGSRVICLHPAFDYLARSAGLDVVMSEDMNTNYNASPGEAAALLDDISEHENALILCDAGSEQAIKDAIRASGHPYTFLNAYTSELPADYPEWKDVMAANIDAIAQTLGD